MALPKTSLTIYRELTVVTVVVTGWLLILTLFFTVGHWVIAQMYAGTLPVDSLNDLIVGQNVHSVSHYLKHADHLFLFWSCRAMIVLLLVIYAVHCGPLLLKADVAVTAPSLPISLLTAFVLMAWSNRFIQDDAFISFRYAANFVHGYGLTWNPGEPNIEGYTNPLWTLLMTIPIRLGYDPILFSFSLGIVCFLCTLLATYRLALGVLGCARLATLCVILLGANYTFSAYATGGLETQMQAMLLVCVALMVFRICHTDQRRPFDLAVVSIVTAAAVLTRLDSLLPIVVIYLALLWALLKSHNTPAVKCIYIAAALLPGLVIGMSYGLWKLVYYGDLLPNTYYAKAACGTSLVRGVKYVWGFLGTYGWLPFMALALARIRHIGARSLWIRPLLIVIAVWIVYVVKVGGCFMEFRFLVPVLPFVVIGILGALSEALAPAGQLAVVVGLLLMSFFHQATFNGRNGVESIRQLSGHISYEKWDEIGKMLGRMFREERPEITIATTAAGAIPYYSELKTVDMLGLSDPWIARNGYVLGTRPGHQRVATAAYLRDRHVNLVVGHPQSHSLLSDVKPYTLRNASFSMANLSEEVLPEGARVIEIPFNHEWAVHVLYFVQSPAVERVIQRLKLRTFPIEHEGKEANKAMDGDEE